MPFWAEPDPKAMRFRDPPIRASVYMVFVEDPLSAADVTLFFVLQYGSHLSRTLTDALTDDTLLYLL